MVWIGIVLLVFTIAVAGMRKAQRAGTWSWSKFALTLGFMAVICAVITAPLLMNTNSRFFWPVYGAAWVVALGLMVCYIIWARHWKFPNSPQK